MLLLYRKSSTKELQKLLLVSHMIIYMFQWYSLKSSHPRLLPQDAQGWCTGMTLRYGMGKKVGRGFRMGDTCTPMADSCQCMAKPTTIL